MKISERWLHAWIKTGLEGETLAEQLTAGGTEVSAVIPVTTGWSRVVVGLIEQVTPHPNADRLRCCRVRVGTRKVLEIVCGAANAAPGLRVPVALAGATLPGGLTIRDTDVRGVRSRGMLCSAKELDLEEVSSGLLILDTDAPIGVSLATILDLPDRVLEIEITPNRGDCLSVLGVARELAFLTGDRSISPAAPAVRVRDRRVVPVSVSVPEACPHYAGRPVYGIDPGVRTPTWMRERLRRSGIRSIHPVVDVTHYVMLEWGQPMHAFALSAISGGIVVRYAKNNESLVLLDGREITVEAGTLLIADPRHPLAIAGVMGGLPSAVTGTSVDVFLESAHFRPESVAVSARWLGLHTEASMRFERGVDPALARVALERATVLLCEIAGGSPGPVSEVIDRQHLPKRHPIPLRRARIERLLGVTCAPAEVARVLRRIDPGLKTTVGGWRVKAPSHRFDLKEECDLLEELARGFGYERLPERLPRAPLSVPPHGPQVPEERIRALLMDRGYHEAITYSFVDPGLEAEFDPKRRGPVLANPIASQLAVMRTGLATGLVQALVYNRRRQQERVRLFELGLCFQQGPDGIMQRPHVGLVATGPVWPRQWGAPARAVDLYDVKGDLEALLALCGRSTEFTLKAAEVPGLHPAQGLEIGFRGRCVGHLGAVHPETQRRLELDDSIILLDIELDTIMDKRLEQFQDIPRFPCIRRDLAVVVAREMPAQTILECIRGAGSDLLTEVEIFDEYHGEGIDSGRKSIAVTLTLQDSSRTLTEETVEAIIAGVISALVEQCSAQLRQ